MTSIAPSTRITSQGHSDSRSSGLVSGQDPQSSRILFDRLSPVKVQRRHGQVLGTPNLPIAAQRRPFSTSFHERLRASHWPEILVCGFRSDGATGAACASALCLGFAKALFSIVGSTGCFFAFCHDAPREFPPINRSSVSGGSLRLRRFSRPCARTSRVLGSGPARGTALALLVALLAKGFNGCISATRRSRPTRRLCAGFCHSATFEILSSQLQTFSA